MIKSKWKVDEEKKQTQVKEEWHYAYGDGEITFERKIIGDLETALRCLNCGWSDEGPHLKEPNRITRHVKAHKEINTI